MVMVKKYLDLAFLKVMAFSRFVAETYHKITYRTKG